MHKKKLAKKNIFIFPRAYSNIGEKGKIADTSAIPQLTRFRSHGGVVAFAIYMRITFFYTRVTYLHQAQVCLMRHTDVHEHQSLHLRSVIVPELSGFLSLPLHISEIRS